MMTSPNFAAILALLTEMARCLNQNIAKVHVAPLDSRLSAAGAANLAKLVGAISAS